MNAREFLFGLERHGIKLGLENINHLLDAAGRPERRYPTVHVAGTNGKGSVVAMLDAMLRAAGLHTGRFTSPHLIDVNERFLYDAQPIPDGELDVHLAFFQGVAERMPVSPTFFELVTAVAFRWFAARRVDVGVVEVGMGGRFDSTNVIAPLACAITNIDREHTRYLGDTLEAIAFEKAGILKEGVPAAVSEVKPGPLEVIRARAEEVGCPVRILGRDYTYTVSGPPFALQFSYESPALRLGPLPLGLTGAYQGENAATAAALAELVRGHFPGLTPEAVARGLTEARWPCRMERVLDDPPVIIDVAHNAAGAEKLAREIDRAVLVLAVSSDKNARAMIDALAPGADPLILTQFQGPRALPVDQLCEAAGNRPYRRVDTLRDAIDLGLERASRTEPLVITGSIFTAGEARRILIEEHGAPPLRF